MILETGKPLIDGRYVAYVKGVLGWLEPKILLWQKGMWTYTFSTEEYADRVYSWIGPLPVLKMEAERYQCRTEEPAEERGQETQFPDEPTGPPMGFDL